MAWANTAAAARTPFQMMRAFMEMTFNEQKQRAQEQMFDLPWQRPSCGLECLEK
jgi:hypothetical protein